MTLAIISLLLMIFYQSDGVTTWKENVYIHIYEMPPKHLFNIMRSSIICSFEEWTETKSMVQSLHK